MNRQRFWPAGGLLLLAACAAGEEATADYQGGGRPVVRGFGRGRSNMKAIEKRLDRLQDRFGLAGETEYDLRLRQRLEAAQRRIAEASACGELPPAAEGRPLTEFDQRQLEILKQAA